MRPLLAVLLGLTALLPFSVDAGDLKESDDTTQWSFPYRAPAEKEKRIRDGVEVLLKGERGTPATKFVEVLGPPDQVTDLSKDFAGMSPNEDGMLMRYRQKLSHRLVWFISKKNKNTANLEDIWFAAYVEKGSDGILKIARNKFN